MDEILRHSFQKQIGDILVHFDFNRVYEAMAQLRWTWWDSDGVTPTIENLKGTARYLLEQATKPEVEAIDSGGFYARREDTPIGPRLTLSFSISEYSAMDVDGWWEGE